MDAMEQVVLFGASKFARDVFIHLEYDSPYEVVAFTVDRPYLTQDRLFDRPVVAFDAVESLFPPDRFKMLVAVGYQRLNEFRQEKCDQAKAKGYQLISYVSEKAVTWPGQVIGDNCLICPNSILSPSAKIGDNVVIGLGAMVGHDSEVQDHCFIGGGARLSGLVTVGPCCFVGTGAIVRDNVTLGRSCIIGAGAVILEDAADRSVYMAEAAAKLPITSDKLTLVRQE